MAPLLALLAALCLVACDNPQSTVDQLRTEIAAYKTTPTDAAEQKIDADFAKLDAQIAKLAESGKTSEAATYRAAAQNLAADYRAAKLVRSMKEAQSAIQGIGETLKDVGQSIGEAFKPSPTPGPEN